MPPPAAIAEDDDPSGLGWALPPVRAWFTSTFGTPTAAQRGGWPSIAAGRHTLICAPTGTGKTLAAFLACLDSAWRSGPASGTSILYVSPLKALNRDIAVNLEGPLAGILGVADRMGTPLRPLSVGVRTGDTTAAERRAQAKRPPDILITTPESLHLLLSSRQRDALRGVDHVIVDEIHDLCAGKRGVSLALLLERLEHICASGFVRIGLSATMRPLDAVARFLGGWRLAPGGRAEPRPVAVVDAGVSKRIELRVASAGSAGGPGLDARILDAIRSHRSTLIFANHRAEVERLTARLNAMAAEGHDAGDDAGPREWVRSHHGSLSLDRRRETEDALKAGALPAVVATASLELGIDVGTIDRVCQVGSPGSVARGLQRVGRAGHSAGEASRADLLARGDAELLELAALAGAMREGAVEPVRIPRHCLDVLAQQVVACVAAGPWDVGALFDLVRGADPYRDLPAEAFESVLAMLSGRSDGIDVRDLRPRLRWDRVADRLEPLPGTRRLALMGGNTIPDSGQLAVTLDDGTRLGAFDEDFVLERRVGDAVLLGTSTWAIRAIDSRRVTVSPAEGRPAVVPFWRGEGLGRSATLGERLGALRREVAARLDDPGLPGWLAARCGLEPEAAASAIAFVGRQAREAGAVPSDQRVVIESFLDPSGVATVALQTPFGSRFHLALKLAIQGRLRERCGAAVAALHADDGLLVPFPGLDRPPLDLLDGLTPEGCEAAILGELWDSPLFRLRFRQVAARALILARPGAAARSPLWFQRLRADELLAGLASSPEHPLIREAVRECLADDLDLPGLRAFLQGVGDGSIAVEVARGASPSPFAAELIRRAAGRPGPRPGGRSGRRRRGWQGEGAGLDGTLPDAPDLRAAWIDPDAIARVDSRLRGLARPPRTAAELAELLRFCGDLTEGELAGPMAPLRDELGARGAALPIRIAGADDPVRWIAAESLPDYRAAFAIEGPGPGLAPAGPAGDPERQAALDRVVRAYLRSHALVNVEEIASRYGIGKALARRILARFARSGEALPVPGGGDSGDGRWADRRNLDDLRGISVALRRKEAVAVEPDVYADLLVRHQFAHPDARAEGPEALGAVLRRLAGFAAPASLWEAEILPRRLAGGPPARLDEFLRTEDWAWRRVEEGEDPGLLAFVPLGFEGRWPEPAGRPPLSADAGRILALMTDGGRSESDDLAERSGLDPARAGRAIDELASRGLIGGDHLDPIRRATAARAPASAASRASAARGRASGRRRPLRLDRADVAGVRWSPLRCEGGGDGPAASIRAWAFTLLDRYGVLCRETAALDAWAPPWSLLREALDASELRGEVRRGYFVSGLSGVQFATGEFADRLARHRPEEGEARPALLSARDPANPFGAGGPFAIATPGGGGARSSRSPSSHVVLLRGRPVVRSEGFGRSLTVLPWANGSEVAEALATLVALAGPSRRILKVQRIDGRPALESPHAGALIEAGFVRNPPGLAYYAGWPGGASAW